MKKICLVFLSISFAIISFAQVDSVSGVKKDSKTESVKKKGNTVSFKADVYPLIKKYCMPCHAEEQMNPSELYMDSYESIIEGGKHGKPIIPGNAKESLLIQKLSEKPPFGDRMPLKSKEALPDEVVKILTEWINQGAKKN